MDQIEGCKLPRHLENPLDDLLMVAIEPTLQPLRDLGVTPNMVTLASAAASTASVVYCFRGRPVLAASLWFVGYVFDVADGFMARRFGMETVLGDRLDHLSDLLAYGGLLAFLVWRVRRMRAPVYWPLAVEAGLSLCMAYHVQCQERRGHGRYLRIGGVDGGACLDERHLAWTRWVGVGTLTAWHVVLILLYARPVQLLNG